LILELVAALGLAQAADAGVPAQTDAGAPERPIAMPAVPPEKDETIERYRTPLDVLSDKMIGAASRAVRYDWRNQTISFGATGGELLELNNFQSERVGGFVRTSVAQALMLELMVTGVLTQGTDSTYALSLTPYRQYARPEHVEVDINLGLPLLEAVTTPRWGWLPTMELVVFLEVDLRYRIFPGGYGGMNAGDTLLALFAPKMSQREIDNLEPRRLPGMAVDTGVYDVLAGLVFEAQLQSGFIIAPRVMLCPPLMNGFTGSHISWWWDISLALGWGF
jgi:hypothetical protein